ncbi:short-chain dehydrogenase [Virgibacillus sp. DJP39]|uniref:short-chain dehydrogenase n=1 Tax=Virgibacillus sp. DJP39 TaxID=3409790 RepID=UPI003BB6F994
MKHDKYALVIGGTGMLAKVCQSLVNTNYYVSVVGRSTVRHQQLRSSSQYPESIHAIAVDYHDLDSFKKEIKKTFLTHGAPDLVISWIHGSAPLALSSLIDEIVRTESKKWRLFDIKGSSRFFKNENTPVPGNCQYRRVYLGFKLDEHGSRWLTHDEIASGVIKAIRTDQLETIVGTLEPWEKRP